MNPIPFELRVKVCSLASRRCAGLVHLYRVQADNDPEPRQELLCSWHGQAWPRTDSKPAEERKRARRRRAAQEGQGLGRTGKLGRGRRPHSPET